MVSNLPPTSMEVSSVLDDGSSILSNATAAIDDDSSVIIVSNDTTISTSLPTLAPIFENIDAAEETHQFDADAAFLLNLTLICCTLLVSL